MKNAPRGIRNNNPGNIRKSPEKWQGLSENQTDPSFFVFKEAKWGIRAIVKIIRNYQKNYGLSTVKAIISRWAPPNENDTTAYIDSVCNVVGVAPEEHINVFNRDIMIPLLRAIIRHENGEMPYTLEELQEGVLLANE